VERTLLIPVLIRHEGPYWFVLDTGIAHSAIDREVAAEAHLELDGKERKHDITAPVQLDIGGEGFEAALDVVDLGAAEYQRAYDQPLAGVLGMDFFQKFIVMMDYDAEVVIVGNASLDFSRERSETIPLRLQSSLPYVEATMKLHGRAAVRRWFLLDTATGDAINDDGFKPVSRAAIGPDLGRAEFFRIGSFQFTGVNGTSGSSKLGGELLHRFRVTVDVPHGRLILEPGRHLRDAFLFDSSGLDIERSENGFRILRVFERAPGEEAGLAAGDMIISIDGQSTGSFTVPQVRLMFHEAGNYTLLVEHDGERRTVELRLRTLL
jgi:hypothetical protein